MYVNGKGRILHVLCRRKKGTENKVFRLPNVQTIMGLAKNWIPGLR